MTDDAAPKSAYEIAMERLKKIDEEAGIERKPVTEEQKAAIAEIRNLYESKLAELELFHQGALAAARDPDELAHAIDGYRGERDRLTVERDEKIELIRSGWPFTKP
jgi:hypothetical protein